MARSLKMSDDVYWDPSGISIRTYKTTKHDDTPVLSGHTTLADDFYWVDCGETLEIGEIANGDGNKGGSATAKITYKIAFSSEPIVVTCYHTNTDAKNALYGQSIAVPINSLTTGFTARVVNNSNVGGTGIDFPTNGCK